MTKNDEIEKSLKALSAEAVQGRKELSEAEKDSVILGLGGPRTTDSIVKAQKTLPKARIPFLFSSLDPQLVADVLENDMTSAIVRALESKKTKAT